MKSCDDRGVFGTERGRTGKGTSKDGWEDPDFRVLIPNLSYLYSCTIAIFFQAL